MDWVVLSAACVALALGVTNVVATEMAELSREVRTQLEQDIMNNPFDIEETGLGSNGCVRIFLDPYADPGATEQTTVNGCAVGSEVNSDDDTTDVVTTTTYSVVITDDEDDGHDDD